MLKIAQVVRKAILLPTSPQKGEKEIKWEEICSRVPSGPRIRMGVALVCRSILASVTL